MSPGESWAGGPSNPLVRLRRRWGRYSTPFVFTCCYLSCTNCCFDSLFFVFLFYNGNDDVQKEAKAIEPKVKKGKKAKNPNAPEGLPTASLE